MLKANKTILYEKLKESLSSVLPITAIVFVLCFTVVPVPKRLSKTVRIRIIALCSVSI